MRYFLLRRISISYDEKCLKWRKRSTRQWDYSPKQTVMHPNHGNSSMTIKYICVLLVSHWTQNPDCFLYPFVFYTNTHGLIFLRRINSRNQKKLKTVWIGSPPHFRMLTNDALPLSFILLELTDNLLANIFTLLDNKSLQQVSRVNRRFNTICYSSDMTAQKMFRKVIHCDKLIVSLYNDGISVVFRKKPQHRERKMSYGAVKDQDVLYHTSPMKNSKTVRLVIDKEKDVFDGFFDRNYTLKSSLQCTSTDCMETLLNLLLDASCYINIPKLRINICTNVHEQIPIILEIVPHLSRRLSVTFSSSRTIDV